MSMLNMERVGYQSLVTSFQREGMHDDNYPPSDHNLMVHVVPEHNKTRWNHVEDLDSFFTRIYYYHQKHGFICIVLQDFFELLQFIFVVIFGTFLLQCVDYPVLFKDKPPKTNSTTGKVSLDDALIPAGECIANIDFHMWVVLLVALLFWLTRLAFVVYNIVYNWEIRAFYRTALGIQDSELDNLTWYDVQKKLRDVQRDQQMCIHKPDLTELDIYHRILRFKNYMVAMVNKSLLPIKFDIPTVGEVVFLTHGMKFNLEMLMFWGPWAPFENSWHLREDYKKVAKRKELAQSLSKRILWVGLANLILSPVIFLWQILYSFFNYAEVVKREPGTLGMRKWSLYGRLYLRHFNELEHEINARLVRAYRPAAKYMGIFTTPLLTIIAQNVMFMSGAIFAALSVLTVYDEDVLTVEHMLLLLTVLGVITAGCRTFIPDEHLVWCPERLLTAVVAHIHYFPEQWKGKAHTSRTRDQFALLFQYKAVYLLEELLSPFVTPLVLIFYLRNKALDIVDFYRNFTVEVVGVGDVCSFAQMDVRKHGNPSWQASVYDMDGSDLPAKNSYIQAENGKTELSLVHFTHTNPEWQPPTDSGAYITNLKERAVRDANLPTLEEENPLFASLNSISSLGDEYSNVVASYMLNPNAMNVEQSMYVGTQQEQTESQTFRNATSSFPSQQRNSLMQGSFRGVLSRHEGPLQHTPRGVAAALNQSGMSHLPSYNNTFSFANSFAQYPNPSMGIAHHRVTNHEFSTVEANAVDMSIDALYLHELHHLEKIRRRSTRSTMNPEVFSHTSTNPPTSTNLQSRALFQSQPQLHSGPAGQQSERGSGDNTEKTPLLFKHS
ncbi:Autophagy-related protein 9A [Orchesella cincta]|uniref:Autophagy-related protein 9 n=1 Tax=Orchesella cincta TaxID=48709 RepID=A0A1D2NKY7_ORCCI|nr:Autophagy-related protein 9A [Orchesella cincta]